MRSLSQHLSAKVSAIACILAAVVIAPTFLRAQQWEIQVGAQSPNKGSQVLAFLPNEIWIHAGDTVIFTSATDEPHTVSFLTPKQVRLPFAVGCPGITPSGGDESGATCVNSGVLASGQGYTLTFPTAGNYKLVCLVHNNMTAMVHVLDPAATLPHNQAYYDAQAADMADTLLANGGDMMEHAEHGHGSGVTAGAGEIVATGGGTDTLSVMRFMHSTKVVHPGDTVEWTNDDPVTPHTITFGTEPANPIPPAGNITLDPDGARHATLSSPSDSAHSGFIVAGAQDQIGQPQPNPGVTRFRVTFTAPGTYNYICALHDGLGMAGKVIVLP